MTFMPEISSSDPQKRIRNIWMIPNVSNLTEDVKLTQTLNYGNLPWFGVVCPAIYLLSCGCISWENDGKNCIRKNLQGSNRSCGRYFSTYNKDYWSFFLNNKSVYLATPVDISLELIL